MALPGQTRRLKERAVEGRASEIDVLTRLSAPTLALIGAGALICLLWIVTGGRGRGGGSGSYAVWILVPFIAIICGGGVWLVVRAMGVTNFSLLH